MSVKIMGKAWELDLETSELLILLAMADHADHEGNNVRPSTRLIAWKTGFSERHVRRVIDKLVSEKILMVTNAPKGKTITYRIVTENGKQKEPLGTDKVSPLTSKTHTPDTVSPPPLTSETLTPDIAMSPEPSVEPSIKLKEVATAGANGNGASKNGHSKNGKEPETREREYVFELVAFLFFGFKDMTTFNNLSAKSKKEMAGRIGKIAAFLRDLYAWDEPVRSLEPSPKVLAIKADCQEFCKWYAMCYSNASRPRDVGKFSEHYLEWYNSKIPEFNKPKADLNCPKCKGAGEWLDKITDPYNHKFVECECVKVLT